ncbi:Positive regulator of CheA protein activity (CheW) [hydrothermal vent metagenome]|uniref:Positive regulator of CheA protein activity (CheW) n=1 Tax=hydrothermal vent metagenome TaxID=652676 RepID=A0A3B0TSL5_9ZZZZ
MSGQYDSENLAGGSSSSDSGGKQLVTIRLGNQMIGLPIEKVHDVFFPSNFTPVPLSAEQIAGVLNLRGRIVTIIDLSIIMGLTAVNEEIGERPAVGVICANESYGLLTDTLGEVVTLGDDLFEPNPVNLDPSWAQLSLGTYRLENELLVVLDIDALIETLLKKEAA